MSEDVIFELARPEDEPAVSAIYEAILDSTDIGWKKGVYPTPATFCEALNAGEMYVARQDGRVVAAGRINHTQVPEYALCSWQYPAPPERVTVLHTLVVDPACGGRGLGPRFVAFYEQLARQWGCPFLRIDTNARNARARAMYRRLGYTERGIVPCNFNGIPDVPLVCLEKYVGPESQAPAKG